MYSPSFGPDRIGVTPGRATNSPTQTAHLASPSRDDAGLLHNPLVAFGAIALVAFGLMAVSTTVRVGNSSAGIKIGDAK